MKIEEVRTSFTVYLIASEMTRFEGISEALKLAGYMTLTFSDLSSAFSELPSNPPHFLIFESEEKAFKLNKAIKQVVAQLPESHIFLLTEFQNREKAVGLLEAGVYTLIYMPLVSQVELIQALDRAAERDYFMYTNERLSEQVAAAEAAASVAQSAEPPTAAQLDDHADPADPDDPEVSINLPPVPEGTMTSFTSFSSSTQTAIALQHLNSPRPMSTVPPILDVRLLFEQRSSDEILEAYLNSVAKVLNAGVIFFKFIANRRVLLAAKSAGVNVSISGVGVDFNQGQSEFRSTHLREPEKIPELVQLIEEVFDTKNFFCHCVDALGEVQGILVYLQKAPTGPVEQIVNDWFTLLGRALSLQEAEKRLHVMSVKDPTTDLLNRQNFINRLTQEISRSRRTMMPVSLALITVDQYGQIITNLGTDEGQTLLRMAARIIEKHSRVIDVVGRTGADEFGLILPHTGKKGALIKVERLRKIIESADFSRVLKEFPSVTISIGVSEYPSMVRDADELLGAADEALYQVRGVGNRTCVSKPPEGFKPDFEVSEKGPL